MNRRKLIVTAVAIAFICVNGVFAQTEPAIDTTQKSPILVDYSDLLEYIQDDTTTYQVLKGNVELRQDSVYMYCDTAKIVNQKKLIAQGNVIIQQTDSLSVFADSLFYDGYHRLANLYNEVVLVNKTQKLFTDSLHYDVNTKVAKYTMGALLTNDTTQLRSRRGEYFTEINQVYFKDSVTIVDPNFELKADTLAFNTKTQIATFLGPTIINQNGSRIYCEAGFYDARNKIAEFRKNAQFIKEEEGQIAKGDIIRYDGKKKEVKLTGDAVFIDKDKRAQSDVIIYDEVNEIVRLNGNASYKDKKQFIVSDSITYNSKKETFATVGRSRITDEAQVLEANKVDYDSEKNIGIAIGDVVWRDTAANMSIVCERAEYNKTEDYIKATGGRNNRPLLISEVDGDSLFMTSDTLFAMRDTMALRLDTTKQDTARMLLAYNDVRIFKNDLQAVCDSLTYSDADSIFRFFQAPIIWSDTSQFVADTISIQLKNKGIHKIFLKQNSLMLNSPDEIFFNQIKGKEIIASFDSSQVRSMYVKANAEAIYYALDEEDAYIGVNQTACSEMLVYFGDNQVKTISFYRMPKGKLIPMQEANHEALKLEGFKWEIDKRPNTLEDLFKEKGEVRKINF